jgi:succinate dehydrogenase/fumarate reductase iron-sulfur protein
MVNKIINVKIQRFDPDKDKNLFYLDYKVPIEEGMSVLDVLDYIYENLDGTISYFSHAACRYGVCANCTLRINGKVTLACQTKVDSDIIIETPKHLKIIKDLIYEK